VSDSGATFRVVVGNAAGSVTSAAATLTVNAVPSAPIIVSQPVGVTVTAGTAAVFSVQANGTAPLTYQWQRDGVNIAGATAASYALASPAVGDSGATFRVVVSNAVGTVTSSSVTLTVAPVVTAPTITTQPQSASTVDGSPATLSVTATGTAPFSYQWRRNGSAIAGATAAIYTTPALTLADTGAAYSVVVTNGGGSVTSANAVITVTALAPQFTAQPADVAVMAGATATFSVAASGSAPLTYQWRRNGIAIAGATSASYTTAATTAADSGAAFSVIVANASGTVTSRSATLTVSAGVVAPTITTAPSSATVTAGQAATFSVVAAGTAPLAYQWRRNGTAITGANASTYTLSPAALTDSGAQFTVVITNSAGSVTSSAAVLTVQAQGSGLTGRGWATGQLLDQTDNEVLAWDSAIDDQGRVTVVYMQYNGTRWQLFATRGISNAAGSAPSWSAPVAIDVQANGSPAFAQDRFTYFFGVKGSPTGHVVAYWTYDGACTATTYRTVAGTCTYVMIARFLTTTGAWEAPIAATSAPNNPSAPQINSRGDIALAVLSGVPTTNFPYYTAVPQIASRAVGAASFSTGNLAGPVSTFDLSLDDSGNMLVAAALTQGGTVDAAVYRGTLSGGFGAAQVLDTRGSAVSTVHGNVSAAGQQVVVWTQNNGTRSSIYGATAASPTDSFVVQDLGLTSWNWLNPLDDGQFLLVDYDNARRMRWKSGTWTTETIPKWQSGFFDSDCVVSRTGNGLCVSSSGLWATYDSALNVVVRSPNTTSPGAGYVLGFTKSMGFGTRRLSESGIGFTAMSGNYDVLPTVSAPAGDGRPSVVNLWGWFLK
jgi:hypothetical protein